MRQIKAKILLNKKIAPFHYLMEIESSFIAKKAKPGQFLHIRCSDKDEPLLRRPISFHRIKKNSVELLYHIVGEGTKLLAEKKKGEIVDVLGPLGNGFLPFIKDIKKKSKIVLIAGGMGVAPLTALAEYVIKKYKSPLTPLYKRGGGGIDVHVLIGAKNKNLILCEKELKTLGCKVKVATEDGSKGHKGYVTDLLELATCDLQLVTYIVCGPKPMLKAVSKITNVKKEKCVASLEEYMACGVGVCLGCAVETINGYKMVCNDGPAFDLREIKW